MVVMTTFLDLTEELLYPTDDGNPMAESTEQYDWIVTIKENLELLLRDRPDVFIAADLAWYPIQVQAPPAPYQAPDVMVVFGRNKGARRSYMQWKEENLGPQVVFEILSEGNKSRKGKAAMKSKFQFYQQHGVEEYYIYDPDEFTLEGWQRDGDRLLEILQMSNWVSPRLGIRFDWQPQRTLELYYPDGQRFLSFLAQGQMVEQERSRAEQERSRAEQERLRAEQERSRALQAQALMEQERSRAEQERSRAEAEQSRAEQGELVIRAAIQQLLGLGLDVGQVANSLGLSIEQVKKMMAD
jgi:Uma2 family endonuclease